MDKIKALLEKSGCKPELVNSICESLEGYKTGLREQFEAEYNAKVEQAKKVCIEETEAHKRELARRLQIFCETKSAAIEAQVARQTALSESEAQTKLRNILSLLEGVTTNGEPNGQVTAKMEKARRQLQKLAEERNLAIEKANRQTQIAEKVIKQNKALATECAQLKSKIGQTITENKRPTRRSGRPTTTRPTLVENQERRPAAKPVQNIQPKGNGFGIADIAASIEE
ncbi:MAG: hypothetical protein H7831_06700 [Magnetococcus sp. WYHC-3]